MRNNFKRGFGIVFIFLMLPSVWSETKHQSDTIDHIMVYTLSPDIICRICDYNRLDFFNMWASEGFHGGVLSNRTEIDSMMTFLDSRPLIDTLKYGTYESGGRPMTTRRGLTLTAYPMPGPMAAIIVVKKDLEYELIWITRGGIERGRMRYEITPDFIKWLHRCPLSYGRN